jgi:chromate reductase, NAD(P)H dehydrogenase (quinone)
MLTEPLTDKAGEAAVVLLVPGSLRAESFNLRLLREMARRLEGRCRIDLLNPREVDLPLFDQDLETQPPMIERVAAVHRRFAAAHGLIVACPEYNGQLTAYLKNLIDWVSRLAYLHRDWVNPFLDRPVLLCSASTGSTGGAVAVPHARALFGYIGSVVLGPTVSVSHAQQGWSPEGFRFAPHFDSHIDASCERLLRHAQGFAGAQPKVEPRDGPK